MTTRTLDLARDLHLSLDEQGGGRPALVLHGGGGPGSVASITSHLARSYATITPTHPGWDATPRPAWCNGVDDLALTYLNLLEDRGLRDVIVVGSSVGGWIAAEMALRDEDAGRITAVILVDAMGVEVPGAPVRDFFALDGRGVAEYSYHDADRYFVDPTSLSDQVKAARVANMATLRTYAGDPYMHDPKLLGRLGRIRVPVLVVWGDSDRIATPDYGRAYAEAFRDARFEVVRDAGHLPHIEQPQATFALLDDYLTRQDA